MRQRRKFVQQTSIVTPTQSLRMLEKTGSGRSGLAGGVSGS
jgi:hypothetical protein